MQTGQLIVVASTIIIFVLSALLALYITKVYLRRKSKPHLFWAAGLWVFSISVLLEIYFAFGLYSNLLMDLYLFLVVLIVELLAAGSLQLLGNKTFNRIFYVFAIVVSAATAYSIATASMGNLVMTYVVAGVPPLSVILASSVATFASAFVIVVVAGASYFKSRNKKLLSIIAGVIVVSIAGTLYIASFPAFLYYSEFFGILLLWIGFV
jgi:hypothetical protein